MSLSLPQPLAVLGRALPRLLAAAIGVASLTSDHTWIRVLAVVVVICAILTPWPSWWTYVRTGHHPAPAAEARFAEPGTYTVTLRGAGPRPISTIKALRAITGAGLAEARRATESTPSVVLENVSPTSAQRAQSLLEEAGASVELTAAPVAD